MKTRANFAEFTNPDTIIGNGVVVEGTLQTAGDIQINGFFKGKLVIQGDVVVGEHAEVVANISAQNVYVAGSVIGDINALEKLEIMETGKVAGNVSSSALAIESGGILKGSSTMREVETERPDLDPTYEVEEKLEAEPEKVEA